MKKFDRTKNKVPFYMETEVLMLPSKQLASSLYWWSSLLCWHPQLFL